MPRLIDHRYRTPEDLARAPSELRRVLVVGSCMAAGIPGVIEWLGGCKADFILANFFAELPSSPPASLDAYDFQIVQIPMRSLLPDGSYGRLSLSDPSGWAALLEDAKARLAAMLDTNLRYHRETGILTFVSNFLLPQVNPIGRAFPRYDVRNPVFFVEELNRFLDAAVRSRPGCHILDVDQIAATLGRRYIQDDPVWPLNHGSALSNWDFENDEGRLEPTSPIEETYPLQVSEYVQAMWYEVLALYRTIVKADTVKLIIVDLDDTLWRGVLGENTVGQIEGWPLGLAEALLFLKARGIVLAIASKNNPAFIEAEFDRVLGANRLSLSDFAIRRINWQPKAENIAEIIRDANVLPDSVVFIDDNPVERAAVQAAFPDIRVLGAELYSIRRVLLWSPETQVTDITPESARRSEMIVAQIEREATRTALPREAFLASLGIRFSGGEIDGASHPDFPRTFELLNKTNQFNTTGRRWTLPEWLAEAATGTRMFAFRVSDKFTDYGIIAVAILRGDMISQFVMSCRVIGLGIEEAVIAELNGYVAAGGAPSVRGIYEPTTQNHLCKELFVRAGFSRDAFSWVKPSKPCAIVPPHITIG